MSKISLKIDAWIREAEEASQWLEDLESRIKHKGFAQSSTVDSARSKLLELGVKLDRLESLLRNLPAKPILTDEDLEFRWKMLEDIRLRTKSLACSLYAMPSPYRPRDVPAADAKECNISLDCYDQDLTKTSCPQDNTQLLKPLLSDAASRSQVQVIGSSMSMFSVWKACSTILLFLGLAALLFFLVLLCTAF